MSYEFPTYEQMIERSSPFLRWIADWVRDLPTLSLGAEMRTLHRRPEEIAVISTDMIMAFCYEGRLAGERVRAIIPAVVAVFHHAYDLGVRNFVLTQDAHSPQAREFGAYGPHAIVGSREAEAIPELARLPFADLFATIPKNSLSQAIGTDFDRWLDEQRQVKDFIVVGNCTDLCIYQLAMHLVMRANAFGLEYRVLLPADGVQTYDLPVEPARRWGAFPHDADLLHLLFLYHLGLNGVTVVRHLER